MIRLFLNTLRSLKNHKIQTLGLMILVIFSTLLYSMMTYSNDVIYVGSDEYFTTQKQEDFSFAPAIELTQTQLLELFTEYEIPLSAFTNGEIMDVFVEYDVDLQPYLAEKAQQLAMEYNFEIEPREQKMFTDTVGDVNRHFLAIKTTKEINLPYVVEGTLPQTDDEVTMNEPFLKANGLAIGDQIEISGKMYTISGSVYDVDQVFPIVSTESPLYIAETDAIIHVSDAEFARLEGDMQTLYSAKSVSYTHLPAHET